MIKQVKFSIRGLALLPATFIHTNCFVSFRRFHRPNALVFIVSLQVDNLSFCERRICSFIRIIDVGLQGAFCIFPIHISSISFFFFFFFQATVVKSKF